MKSSLENFQPRLRPGRVIPQGSRIVFETDNPYNQVILPMDLADLILLCSGQFSVREIVAKIYKKQGAVPFKSILKAIHVLHQGGFFENGNELTLNSELQSWMEPRKPGYHLTWRLVQRIVVSGHSPTAYYLVTLAVLILAICGLQHFPAAPVEALQIWLGTHDKIGALLLIFGTSSMLMTIKHLLRGGQQLLLTGKAYNISARLNFMGAHLHVGSEANDLFDNRLYTAMFYLSQILAPWMVTFLAVQVFPSAVEPLVIASLALTFWELNPFVNSDGLKLIRSLILTNTGEVASWHFETSQLIDAISPEQRQLDQEFVRICAIWGGIWSVMVFALLHQSAIRFGPAVAAEFYRYAGTSSAAAGLVLLAWLSSLYMTIQTLIEVVLATLVRPHWQRLARKFAKLTSHTAEDWTAERIAKKIEPLPLFSHFHGEFMQMIIQRSRVMEYPEGAYIIREGEPSLELFVLLSGDAIMARKTRSGRMEVVSQLSPISVIGEASLVDDGPRSIEIKAANDCVLLNVPVHALREVANEAQSVRHLDDFRNAILVNQFFASSPVFRSLSPESIDFLSSRGTLEYFDRDQRVFAQGETGDCLYLILRGGVQVDVFEKRVKRLYQGSFFGEISMIANVPRTATITAVSPCIFFKISADSFWEVLVQHMDLGVFLETISESRLREDLEIASDRAASGDS